MNMNEALQQSLYDKLSREQDKYRDWLKGQPPEEILHHSYEYTVREDILMSMEELTLSEAETRALLLSPSLWRSSTTNSPIWKPATWTQSATASRTRQGTRQKGSRSCRSILSRRPCAGARGAERIPRLPPCQCELQGGH